MRCPKCQSLNNRVMDSRFRKEGNVIRRRRECLDCLSRFTTYEQIDASLPMVIKKDGRREKFSREKIRSGVVTACQKRPVPVERIDAIVEEVISQVTGTGDREVATSVIGEMVMERLHDLDDVAYVRFASVYRAFTDATQFMSELRVLMKDKKEKA